jgi:hypothetical protein
MKRQYIIEPVNPEWKGITYSFEPINYDFLYHENENDKKRRKKNKGT